MNRRVGALCATLVAIAAVACPAAAQPPPVAWLAVEYGEIIDRRQPTHSGEPVGVLLDRLDGRILPASGDRPQDRLDHTLLDPWTEPYAYVLPDAIEALGGPPDPPFAELAWRWSEGEAQPAWVELLRARRLLVETDGAGTVRVFLPVPGAPPRDPREAARAAWDDAWPVLRHVLETVRREQVPDGALQVDAYPYLHRQERSEFLVGTRPFRIEVGADGGPPTGAALDLEALRSFLASGLTLEGARLDRDGTIRPFGADRGSPPTLLGEPITLADLAVAYRAVFHGGLAEPYMSLDRGFAPESAIVNYGGRLRDTRLGDVALRCDVRFKTFSLGLDVLTGDDVRSRLRETVPEFRTHLERFAADPAAGAVLSQQTRLWFYPDTVDLTLSEQGDIVAFRSVRMSAASERVNEGGVARASDVDPPWTRATVEAVNADYDALAEVFPELDDLDQVVRLLALFTWLRLGEQEGLPVADLDALLTVELPAWTTPRRFPQLLAFNALPEAVRSASPDGVVTWARDDVQAALDRLRRPDGTPLPARRRFRRAVARLDPAVDEHRRLLDELRRYDSAALDDIALDFLAYRAERLAMHGTVLSTLPAEVGRPLAARVRAGEDLRIFSVAIGGLDLGLAGKFGSAPRRNHGLLASAAGRPPAGTSDDASAVAAPQRARPVGIPSLATAASPPPPGRVERTVGRSPQGDRGSRVLADPFGPGARLRAIVFPEGGGPARVVRHESGRTVAYRVERFGDRVRIRSDKSRRPAASPEVAAVPGGVAEVRVGAPVTSTAGKLLGTADPDLEGGGVRLEFRGPEGRQGAATFARAALLRVLLGAGLERAGAPIAGLEPLPPELGEIERLLVRASVPEIAPPWETDAPARAPEEHAARLAAALGAWYDARAAGRPRVAVAVRADAAQRFADVPGPGRRPYLLVPADAFDAAPVTRAEIVTGWRASGVELPRKPAGLTVLVDDGPADRVAALAARLAADPALVGRLLAVVSVGGALRADTAARLLEAGDLAGVGILEVGPTEVHGLPARIRGWADAIERAGRRGSVVDLPDGPLWYF